MASFFSSFSCLFFLLLVSLSSCLAFNLEPIRLVRDKTETEPISPGRKVGGRSQVLNVESDKKVQELGRFCVQEFNHHCKNGELLSFCKVVKAQRQVVSGLKYYLRIATTVKSESKNRERVFDAIVVVKPWLGSQTLESFVPSESK